MYSTVRNVAGEIKNGKLIRSSVLHAFDIIINWFKFYSFMSFFIWNK